MKDNMMIKTCKVCKKRVKIGLSKPYEKKVVPNLDVLIETPLSSGKKKKRKSKKDRFSGLVPSAVMNAKLSLGFTGDTSEAKINSSVNLL